MTPGHKALHRLAPWLARSDSERVFRAEVVIGASLVMSVLGAFSAVQMAFDPTAARGMFALCAAASVLFASNVLLVRWARTASAAAAAVCVEFSALFFTAATVSAGYRLYSSPWTACLPLVAVFLLGHRGGVIFALFSMGQALVLYVVEARGWYRPPNPILAAHPLIALTSLASLLAVMVAIGVVYERAHNVRRRRLEATVRELEEAREQLSTAQEQLLASEKLSSLGMLAAGIAHEINNPMAYITSNISSLRRDFEDLRTRDDVADEYRSEVLPATLDGIARINTIVADLRRFARGDPEAFTQCDVNVEVGAALRVAQSQIKAHNCRVDVDLGKLPPVMARPRQLMQVFVNLVVNAAQANVDGGAIRVSSWAAYDDVAVRVQDTGPGMSKEILSKLFQPFFTTKPPGEGTGLGLPVSHGIITSHGGRIEVESSPGQGACFTVWIPKVPPVSMARPQLHTPPPPQL
jgi:signal transduction histidine kinase